MSAPPNRKHLPHYKELLIPTLKALIALGGSGCNAEINQQVYALASISEEDSSLPHIGGKDAISEIDFQLSRARSYLKYYGLINNSTRGVWTINDASIVPDDYTPADIIKHVNEVTKQQAATDASCAAPTVSSTKWQQVLLDCLYSMLPDAFERLAQRLLRESGFSHVEVTGKSGDGGIDGKGIMSLHGLLSFRVVFQCKRFRGAVSAPHIRDFRGAMQGRADKAILITTGSFTREAINEATREGVPLIDLVDGATLCDALRRLQLGVYEKLKRRNNQVGYLQRQSATKGSCVTYPH